MRNLCVLIVALFVAAACIAPASPALAQSKVWAHFLVVSGQTPQAMGMEEIMAQFQQKLAELAGGYTYLGKTQGGYLPAGGKLETEHNYSYLISAPQDLTPQLEKLAGEFFTGSKPFILVWPAQSNY